VVVTVIAAGAKNALPTIIAGIRLGRSTIPSVILAFYPDPVIPARAVEKVAEGFDLQLWRWSRTHDGAADKSPNIVEIKMSSGVSRHSKRVLQIFLCCLPQSKRKTNKS
jgi:hypothetical protein